MQAKLNADLAKKEAANKAANNAAFIAAATRRGNHPVSGTLGKITKLANESAAALSTTNPLYAASQAHVGRVAKRMAKQTAAETRRAALHESARAAAKKNARGAYNERQGHSKMSSLFGSRVTPDSE